MRASSPNIVVRAARTIRRDARPCPPRRARTPRPGRRAPWPTGSRTCIRPVVGQASPELARIAARIEPRATDSQSDVTLYRDHVQLTAGLTMRWEGRRTSQNVEDRRGMRFGRAGGIGLGTIVLALVAVYFGAGSVGRAARHAAFGAAGGTGAVPGIGRGSAAARVRLGRARGYRGHLGRDLRRGRTHLRAAHARAVLGRRRVGVRLRAGRGRPVLLSRPITRSTSTCPSIRTCRAASARPATSRRRTSSRMKSAITCRRCSAFPSATRRRASARAKRRRTRFRCGRSCRPIASPASGRTTPTARDSCSKPATSKKV